MYFMLLLLCLIISFAYFSDVTLCCACGLNIEAKTKNNLLDSKFVKMGTLHKSNLQ